MQGSGGLLIKYSFGECKGQAEFPTEYSFSVYRVQAEMDQLNIQLVCAGIWRITDQIFIGVCTSRLPIGYSLIALGGLELNI